jgi:hypothetical protein
MRLILYSKPGCHLCEGLEEKLNQIQSLQFELEIRDITTREDWFQRFQYEIPVLMLEPEAEGRRPGDEGRQEAGGRRQEVGETGSTSDFPLPTPDSPLPALVQLPRFSPRGSVAQLEQMLQKYWNDPAQ